jgi:NAD(P)-dependent dehydrogenase (short-subunit alcohol dehydrogenase family)
MAFANRSEWGEEMCGSLDGKVAIVTGGGTGIGESIVRELVTRGARVCLTGRRLEPLQALSSKLPSGSVIPCAADVSLEGDARRVVQAAVDFGGGLHIVVNNAAVGPSGSLESMDLGDWQQALAVNLTGPMLVTREAIPHLRASSGSVVNIASVGGFRPVPGEAAYCASKAGLIMLTQQAALDYGPHGIRFNAVAPGRIRTPMGDADMARLVVNAGADVADGYREVSRYVPMRRVGLPEEIARAVAFLASDDASFITGSVLVADGGSTLVNVSQLSFLGAT